MLSWEKSHFMVGEGVVLGHIVSGNGLEVDKAKIEVIQNLPLPILQEISWARRLLSEIRPRLCESLQATHHPSLQGQRFHHRRRREACIHDASEYVVGAVVRQRLDKKPTAI